MISSHKLAREVLQSGLRIDNKNYEENKPRKTSKRGKF